MTRPQADPRPTPEPATVMVVVADLQAVLDDALLAYEAAHLAADEGLVDFGPFAPLTRAIRVLRGLVRSGGGVP